MPNNTHILIVALTILVLFLSSCSRFTRVQKNGTPEEKFIAAQRYFNKEDYYRAGILLEELRPLYRGRKESELIQYYAAYCKYYNRELELAAYFFKNFYNMFPRSEHAQEALYMVGISKYESTPPYYLDQSFTLEAIASLQNFITAYPDATEQVNNCRAYIDDLRFRLEKKNYHNTKIYFQTKRYQAFAEAQEVFKKQYPMSAFNEELEFLAIRALENVADNSVSYKMKPRYEKTIEKYLDFVDNYPASKNLQEAENIYISSRKKLNDINERIEEFKEKQKEEKEQAEILGLPQSQ